MKPGRIFEIQVSVEEALTNSVKHAGGGRLEFRTDDVLQVEVADSGSGIDFSMLPRPVLMLGFSTKGTLGFGFNIMLEFTDHLYLTTGPSGTTIILEYNLRQIEQSVKGYPPLNKWFEVHIYPYENGLSVYFSDSTERKRAEKSLIEVNQTLQALVKASPLAIIALNPWDRVSDTKQVSYQVRWSLYCMKVCDCENMYPIPFPFLLASYYRKPIIWGW